MKTFDPFSFLPCLKSAILSFFFEEPNNDGWFVAVISPGQRVTCLYAFTVHFSPLGLEEGSHLLFHGAGILLTGLPPVVSARAYDRGLIQFSFIYVVPNYSKCHLKALK